MPSNIKAIFFDLDGTLTDYVKETNYKLNRLWDNYRKYLLKINKKDFIDSYWQVTNNRDLKFLVNQRALPPYVETIERFSNVLFFLKIFHPELAFLMGEFYRNLKSPDFVQKNVSQVLNLLRRKYILAIITDGKYNHQLTKLKRLNLDKFFKQLFATELVKKPKPDKEILNYACKSLKVRPEQVIMVGNHPVLDLKPAKQLGMKTILFISRSIFYSRELWEDYVDKVFFSYEQLPAIIEQLS